MTRPNFIEWLRDTDGPRVFLRDIAEFMDWVGQGLGDEELNALLTAVKNSDAYLRTEKKTTELWIIGRVGRGKDWLNLEKLPWQLTRVAPVASMPEHGTIVILFAPITNDRAS
jgi:hypothetical protein